MKKFTAWDFFSLLFVIANFVIGIIMAPSLPDLVPIHWDINGQIDNYGSNGFIIWQIPLFILGLYLLMTFVPFIDPKNRNYSDFSSIYGVIKFIMTAFLSILLWISTAATVGVNVQMNLIVPLLIGFLFIILGILIPKVKQNYFVGVRTPWAIENEEVWVKTQRVGGMSFVIGGILMILLGLTKLYYLFFAVIILILIYPFIYSYLIYRKIKK